MTITELGYHRHSAWHGDIHYDIHYAGGKEAPVLALCLAMQQILICQNKVGTVQWLQT